MILLEEELTMVAEGNLFKLITVVCINQSGGDNAEKGTK